MVLTAGCPIISNGSSKGIVGGERPFTQIVMVNPMRCHMTHYHQVLCLSIALIQLLEMQVKIDRLLAIFSFYSKPGVNTDCNELMQFTSS